jgi:hypothetical protein
MHRLRPTFAVFVCATAAASATASATALGQRAQVFPLVPAGAEALVDGLRYQPDSKRVQALSELDSVVLTQVALPDGRTVELDLVRLDLERLKFRYYVDGAERQDLLLGTDLSVWKGAVRGEPTSHAMLSFSQLGAQGWIATGDELVHLTPRPDAAGNWWNGDVLMASERALNDAGMRLDNLCDAARPPREAVELPAGGLVGGAAGAGGGSSTLLGPGCSVRECKLALESDYQYFLRFNDTTAQAVYTTTLWAYISDRYETQISTILTFPYVGFYSAPGDPWSTPDAPGSSGDMLNEFRDAWLGAVPNGARLGHFMSGASLGGGVAWLDVLCSNSFNFAVSGNINAGVNFPVVQAPTNWDFMVCAHELGHNFNALHSHDYCPPLDECPPSQYFGQCQSQQVCTNQGTIMSYCHLCSGGTGNITTFFHPTSAQFMTQAAQNCLPTYSGIEGDAPSLIAPATTTDVLARVAGDPVGPVQLLWRPNSSASFTAIAMTNIAGGTYSAQLPSFGCADSPQFYYAFNEQSCGLLTYPAGAPANVLEADVGLLQPTFADDFESDTGWTTSVAGATAGQWQRGVPVNDPGWDYDPATDGDGSGSCWLTQNQAGNTDVDGGSVTLVSPQLDLTAPSVRVEYLYYLRLTNTNGDDRLLVQISANGAAGPWVEIARHTQNQGSAWVSNSITGQSIAGAGVVLGSNMRVRFTANDGGTQTIVEAGLDGFRVVSLDCDGVGVNYCTTISNSSGFPADFSASGSSSLAANDLALRAAPVPANSNGIFFFGVNAIQTPFGNGVRCVGSPSFRFPTTQAVGGSLDLVVDNLVHPASTHFAAGATFNFQAWFRDSVAGGAFFNLSDGYRITFAP